MPPPHGVALIFDKKPDLSWLCANPVDVSEMTAKVTDIAIFIGKLQGKDFLRLKENIWIPKKSALISDY